jgi:hypothetical protein
MFVIGIGWRSLPEINSGQTPSLETGYLPQSFIIIFINQEIKACLEVIINSYYKYKTTGFTIFQLLFTMLQ